MKYISCRVNEESCMLEVINTSLSNVEKSIIEEVINCNFDNCESEYKDKFIVSFVGKSYDVFRFEVSLKNFTNIESLLDYESEQEELMNEKIWKETIELIDKELMSA